MQVLVMKVIFWQNMILRIAQIKNFGVLKIKELTKQQKLREIVVLNKHLQHCLHKLVKM